MTFLAPKSAGIYFLENVSPLITSFIPESPETKTVTNHNTICGDWDCGVLNY